LEVELRVHPPENNGSASARSLPDQTAEFSLEPPDYEADQQVATRQAYGTSLAKLGAANPAVVALDGDTKNSTYSQDFLKQHPERFFECFIAGGSTENSAV